MEPHEPRKLIVHTGDELAAELAAQRQAEQRAADRDRMPPKAAAARQKTHRPARAGDVEILKLLLALADFLIFIALVASQRANAPKDGILALLNIFALIGLTGGMIIFFFLQATVATYLQKLAWPFWAVALGTVIGLPLTMLLVIGLRLFLDVFWK